MSKKSRNKRRSQHAGQAKNQTLHHFALHPFNNNCSSTLSEANPDLVEYYQKWMMGGDVVIDPSGTKSLVKSLPDDHVAFLTCQGRTLTCTVADPNKHRLLSLTVNPGDQNSQSAWNQIHEQQTLALLKKTPGKAPDGNWCAMAFHQTTPLLECFGWLPNLDRSLPWAWLTLGNEYKEIFRKRLSTPDHQMGRKA